MENKLNFMNVPAAVREFEKIEMVRQLDGVYRLDHVVTATQKKILKALGIGTENVKYKVAYISEELRNEVRDMARTTSMDLLEQISGSEYLVLYANIRKNHNMLES